MSSHPTLSLPGPLVILLITTFACAPAIGGTTGAPHRATSTAEQVEALWVEPADIASRDLYHGRGGERLAPRPGAAFRFKKLDTSGHSDGYDVEDPEGRVWDVKIGDEAQSETVASRILWAIGYHQPVIHYVPNWRMIGGPTATPGPGRFRLESDHTKEGEWSWRENPFLATRPYRGLVVANWLLNNWDLAASQNRIYGSKGPQGSRARWFVVQDLGAAFGKGGWPLGSRNVLEDFESQDFIQKVENGRVTFDYHSRHNDLLKEITPADVVWTCRLIARLSDPQLHDAFRAAGYPREARERFVRKIRQKLQEGLTLASRPGESS